MKKMYIGLYILLTFVLCDLTINSKVFASPGIPQMIPFSGFLRDTSRAPLSGSYDMTFSLYDTPSGGAPLWVGQYGAIPVSSGYFMVLLGSGDQNELLIDTNEATYYLGIAIEGDEEMVPRERIGSSLYALNADRIDGLDSSQFARTDEATEFTTEDPVSFFGGIRISDGSAVSFGDDTAGLTLTQDIFKYGTNELVIGHRGISRDNPYVNIVVPQSLYISSNAGDDGNGNFDPSIALLDTGEILLQSQFSGSAENRKLNILTTSGVTIGSGNLTVEAGNIGIGTTDPQVSLDVVGAIRSSDLLGGPVALSTDAQGNIIRDPSDERLKTNIRPIDNPLSTLLGIRGVRYEWKDKERFGDETEIGFIAQELKTVLPEVVRDGGPYLSVNTKNVTALIVEAVKELYMNIELYLKRTQTLEYEVAELKRMLSELEGDQVNVKNEDLSEERAIEASNSTQVQQGENIEVTQGNNIDIANLEVQENYQP